MNGTLRRLAWTLLGSLALAFGLVACNPFLADRGAAGQPCLGSGICKGSLVCVAGLCHSPVDGGPDGGDGEDGGDADDGDADPCLAPDLDCAEPHLPGQGEDDDEDGWGRCCDCDDANDQVHPGAAEIPYNGTDDDCHPETRDDDLDEDGYPGSDGSDCDDQNPDVNPGQTEACNGIDDNCDQQTDEGLAQAPCPLTEGVCAGTMRDCQGAAGWTECVYPDTHSLDPETVCDLLDNDCDGLTDEDGEMVLEPESGAQAEDGIDNNCNGVADEPGGVMVPIPLAMHRGVWIDAYEMTVFDNPDCTGIRYGAASNDYPADWPADGSSPARQLYACSVPDILPSSHLSWYQAKMACEAQGKRLCHKDEYRDGCSLDAAAGHTYPYGSVFSPGICNDAIGGSGQKDPTGQWSECGSPSMTFDMSGNLAEWLLEWSGFSAGNAITAGYGYSCVLCFYGPPCSPCDPAFPEQAQWIGFLSMCTAGDVFGDLDDQRSFPADQGQPFIGSRCCYEPD